MIKQINCNRPAARVPLSVSVLYVVYFSQSKPVLVSGGSPQLSTLEFVRVRVRTRFILALGTSWLGDDLAVNPCLHTWLIDGDGREMYITGQYLQHTQASSSDQWPK